MPSALQANSALPGGRLVELTLLMVLVLVLGLGGRELGWGLLEELGRLLELPLTARGVVPTAGGRLLELEPWGALVLEEAASPSTSRPGVVRVGVTGEGLLVLLPAGEGPPPLVGSTGGLPVPGCGWGPSAPSKTRRIVFRSGYFSPWHRPAKSSVSMLHIIMPPKPIDLANWALSAKLCMSS